MGQDKPREVYLLKHGALEKFIVELLLEVEKIQGSNLSLRKANETQEGLKPFMALHYQEDFNGKTWQKYLIRK